MSSPLVPVIPTYFVGLADFVKHHENKPTKVSERTVKRWLSAGELPGAYKNEHGAWQIPIDAWRTAPADESQAVMLSGRGEIVHEVQYEAPEPMPAPRQIPAGRTFFSAVEAAELMSCPEVPISAYAIKKNREYYHAVESGPNGMIVVPAYRILELKGLLTR